MGTSGVVTNPRRSADNSPGGRATPRATAQIRAAAIFFGQLTDKAIRRGIFHSVPHLIKAIEAPYPSSFRSATPR
jgi:hypothetical protein